jgi:peptidoglycan hydrolase CwlO-like protein
MNEQVFDVYASLSELNKRLTTVEKNMPNYLADLLEIGRNIGFLTKRIQEQETEIRELKEKLNDSDKVQITTRSK